MSEERRLAEAAASLLRAQIADAIEMGLTPLAASIGAKLLPGLKDQLGSHQLELLADESGAGWSMTMMVLNERGDGQLYGGAHGKRGPGDEGRREGGGAQTATDDSPGNDLAIQMRRSAEIAVRTVRELAGVELNYSPETVKMVDLSISAMTDEWSRAGETKTDQEKWRQAVVWGAYVGEVIRRSVGGTWQWMGEGGGRRVCLAPSTGLISPPEKVMKRLTLGKDHGLMAYYDGIRQLASGTPAGSVRGATVTERGS